jgi:hypothetical protein
MPKFPVIAEFLDRVTGERRRPGQTVEAEGQRIEDLRSAGVIGAEIQEKPTPPAEKPGKLLKEDLVKIAALVNVDGDQKVADLVKALEAKQPELVQVASSRGIEAAEAMTVQQLLEAIHKANEGE